MRRVNALASLFPLLLSLSLALFNSVPSAASSAAALDTASASLAPPQSAALSPGTTGPGATGPLIIPFGRPPTIDGSCIDQYTDAVALTYPDAFGKTGTAYVKHDNVNLYICLQAVAGQFSNRFASVYLDTFHDDAPFAESADYALRADIITGTLSSFKGTGVANGYVPVTLNGWTAKTTFGNADTAEYSIPLALTGGACGKSFGLAIYHHWVSAVGDDYGWPSNHYFDQPVTWAEVQLGSLSPCAGQSNLAYVYRYDTAKANDFKALLTSAGFTVDLIPLATVVATNFTNYQAILIADDTGNLGTWGTPAQVSAITGASKPIIGLGEGGYAFFGKSSSAIGWPNGWHGPNDRTFAPSPTPAGYYVDPYDLTGLLGGPFKLYNALSNEVAIYVPGAPPPGVTVLGWEPPSSPQGKPDHAPLIGDACYELWGFSDGPANMTALGQRLFINAVVYSHLYVRCAPPPPPNCVVLTKTAKPSSGTPVHPGDTIQYTVSYTVSDNLQCAAVRAVLQDSIPAHTIFVPGSAGPNMAPNIEGTLSWNVGPLKVATSGSVTFSTVVVDTACAAQRPITNTAHLQTSVGVFSSNTTSNPVVCPPVTFPNDQPPYAEDDIQIYPYPLVTGSPSKVSARVTNLTGVSQTVTVTFMTSPNRFGIGLPFAALPVPNNPRVITLGPHAIAQVQIDWTPVSSGHYCLQVMVQGAGFAPIFTQRNLDVTEDLKPGVEDVLTFTVGNPTPSVENIILVVDNTCPGWTAWVVPALLSSVGANDSDLRTVALHVIPPTMGALGTACHIDVQGWINGHLIGGIRKLDVPPVNLPHSDPPWLEQEISTIPSPPISGTVNQACVELQNPLPFSRVVTVTFSEAAFGAGIPFTPFKTATFTLPPNSLQKYCVNWTPLASASLHRCLLVTLKQPGFEDQRSQRNVDLVHRSPLFNPASIRVPFSIGNPYPFTSTVNLKAVLIGLNNWIPKIIPDPPPELMPGQVQNFTLELVPAVQLGQAADTQAVSSLPAGLSPQAGVSTVGDVVRVDVSLSLNDNPQSGFSVELGPPLQVFMPIALKQ